MCFGLFTVEALLADVHDGDATHEELVRVDGDRHAELHPALATDAGRPPGERESGEPGHSEHACHCVHAHGIWSPAPVAQVATTVAATEPPGLLALELPSPALEPHLRPPIA